MLFVAFYYTIISGTRAGNVIASKRGKLPLTNIGVCLRGSSICAR